METEQKTINKAPKITKDEVDTWENNFKEKVSPLVQFYQQDNGHSMKLYNGESGVVAFWAGIIKFKAEDYIKWEFDSLAGVKIDSKMSLTEDTQRIPSNLYDFFKMWQIEISKTITKPSDSSAGSAGAPNPPEQTPDLAGPESANAPMAPEAGAETPLAESFLITNKSTAKTNTTRVDIGRKNNIMDSAERMRRLAGL